MAAHNSAKTQETKNRLEEIDWAHDYAEPGYSLLNKKAGIYVGDWNSPTIYDPVLQRIVAVSDGNILPRLKEALEKAGANTEWSDEWASCDDCGRIGRTIPDSYGWQFCLIVDLAKGTCFCKDCCNQNGRTL